MHRPSFAVVGCGRVGGALGQLLKERGYPAAAVASRTPASAEKLGRALGCPALPAGEAVRKAGLVFITTPDREIAPVSAALAAQGAFRPGQVVAHTSGAHGADELKGVREAGALAVSIHPLQSFADVEGAKQSLPGSWFALEGDAGAMPLARQVVADLNGHAFTINAADKPLYHAAACIASNYLVSLMHLATGLYGRFGLSRAEAFQALLPLVQGTVNNIARVGPVAALTGPIARGDSSTVAGHLPALERAGAAEAFLYRVLGLYTVKVALEKGGINRRQAEEMEALLGEAPEITKEVKANGE